MATTETILRVFVASPGDVAEERAALEDVIQELNITRNRPLGGYLELVKWETHTFPGIGKRTLSILDRLDEEFATASNLTSEMEKVFDGVITD